MSFSLVGTEHLLLSLESHFQGSLDVLLCCCWWPMDKRTSNSARCRKWLYEWKMYLLHCKDLVASQMVRDWKMQITSKRAWRSILMWKTLISLSTSNRNGLWNETSNFHVNKYFLKGDWTEWGRLQKYTKIWNVLSYSG